MCAHRGLLVEVRGLPWCLNYFSIVFEKAIHLLIHMQKLTGCKLWKFYCPCLQFLHRTAEITDSNSC